MPRCCCCRFSLSTFHFCPCCCTVPTSNEALPLLDADRQLPINYDDATINEIYVHASYVSSKKKSPQKSRIRIVTTSDTHMHHESLRMPPGDVLVVAGDITNWKTTKHNQPAVLQWLNSLTQYEHKIVICGNHEVDINENEPEQTAKYFQQEAGAIYLQDSAFEAFGLKFYGTPWHPKRGCFFHAEAFAKPTKDLQQIFERIPSDTDVIISHVPPYGIRDNETAGHIGSDSLLKVSKERVKPIMHVFGHVHGTNGISYVKGTDTVYVNTATRVNVFDVIFEDDTVELVVDNNDKRTDEYKVEDEEDAVQ